MAGGQTVEQLLREVIGIGIALSSERDLDTLLERILTGARHITGAEAGTLFVREGEALRFGVVQNAVLLEKLGDAEMKRRLMGESLELQAPSLAAYVARTGEVLNIPNADKIPTDRPYRCNPAMDRRYGYQSKSFLVIPLTEPSGRILGVLQLINALNEHGEPIAFNASQQEVVQLLGSQAAVAMRNAQLEQLSFKDPLTEVHNRRYFALRLREEIKRAQRTHQALSLAIFDLDNFKMINDQYGHLAGDEVLRQFAQVLVNQSREYTVLARYGGDEFVALLPATTTSEALAYAQRLARLIERYPFPHARLTTSIGVASVTDTTRTGDALIEAADAALYRAKHSRDKAVPTGAISVAEIR